MKSVLSAAPSIGGTPAPGQTLTCKPGVSTTGGVTLSLRLAARYQGNRRGHGLDLHGQSGDVSHHLQCRVIATTAAGSESATSAFVTVPAGGLGTISETRGRRAPRRARRGQRAADVLRASRGQVHASSCVLTVLGDPAREPRCGAGGAAKHVA